MYTKGKGDHYKVHVDSKGKKYATTAKHSLRTQFSDWFNLKSNKNAGAAGTADLREFGAFFLAHGDSRVRSAARKLFDATAELKNGKKTGELTTAMEALHAALHAPDTAADPRPPVVRNAVSGHARRHVKRTNSQHLIEIESTQPNLKDSSSRPGVKDSSMESFSSSTLSRTNAVMAVAKPSITEKRPLSLNKHGEYDTIRRQALGLPYSLLTVQQMHAALLYLANEHPNGLLHCQLESAGFQHREEHFASAQDFDGASGQLSAYQDSLRKYAEAVQEIGMAFRHHPDQDIASAAATLLEFASPVLEHRGDMPCGIANNESLRAAFLTIEQRGYNYEENLGFNEHLNQRKLAYAGRHPIKETIRQMQANCTTLDPVDRSKPINQYDQSTAIVMYKWLYQVETYIKSSASLFCRPDSAGFLDLSTRRSTPQPTFDGEEVPQEAVTAKNPIKGDDGRNPGKTFALIIKAFGEQYRNHPNPQVAGAGLSLWNMAEQALNAASEEGQVIVNSPALMDQFAILAQYGIPAEEYEAYVRNEQ